MGRHRSSFHHRCALVAQIAIASLAGSTTAKPHSSRRVLGGNLVWTVIIPLLKRLRDTPIGRSAARPLSLSPILGMRFEHHRQHECRSRCLLNTMIITSIRSEDVQKRHPNNLN